MKKITYSFKISKVLATALLILIFTACTEKLDVKPNQALLVPSSPADLQAAIDNSPMYSTHPSLGELGTDNYYLLTTTWQALPVISQNIYIWAKDIYFTGSTVLDWNNVFIKLRITNVVLESLNTMASYNNTPEYNNVKGSALFYRAYIHYALAQVFCKPYNAASAGTDVGLPLLLRNDLLHPPVRVSVQRTYDQIIADLDEARTLLPATTPYKTRPTQTAVDAMLARVYLSMEDYDKALNAADAALKAYSTLIDYNTLKPADAFPLKLFNEEVIFHTELSTQNSSTAGGIFFNSTTCAVDTTLYRSYAVNDIRKAVFFTSQSTGIVTFKGSYMGTRTLFGGLATDELYLVRAECSVRKGNVAAAMADLNSLMQKRWKGTYTPMTASNATDALAKVLVERRKELLFRGLRWTDLRRLNKDPDYAVTLSRKVNNQTYTLPPNSSRYVYPIPPDEISISGMQQNERQ